MSNEHERMGRMDEQCKATLSLILPGEDDPSVRERCEKRAGHRDYHGTLSGHGWETSNSDR